MNSFAGMSLLEYLESMSISLLEASLFLSLYNVPEFTIYNNFSFDNGDMSSSKRHVLILLLFIMKWFRIDSSKCCLWTEPAFMLSIRLMQLIPYISFPDHKLIVQSTSFQK